MGKVPFTGLVYVIPHAQNKQTQKLNNFMEIGGEDFQMVKANIKNQMVNLNNYIGDFYIGGFKNGLKHGDGV